MGTIADKLEYLNDTKTAIKGALQNRGVTVSDTDTFRSYADKIGDIGETVEKTKFGASLRSFSGCGRRPCVPSTCAGDLRELLRVSLRRH